MQSTKLPICKDKAPEKMKITLIIDWDVYADNKPVA